MKFGINFLPDVDAAVMPAQTYLKSALDLCADADQLGYASIKITEHYLGTYGGYCPSPILFLGAAAQRTRAMRLVTGCVLPVFSHPLKLASDLAMLDCISGGRLEVGVARAWLPHEFAAFNIPIDQSRVRFEEGIAAMIRLWTEEEVTFAGQFHQFEGLTALPRPLQEPHPPLRVAVVMTPDSFAWAGQRGYSLMITPQLSDFDVLAGNLDLYRRSFREHGHGTPSDDRVMSTLYVYVDEESERARFAARPWMERSTRAFSDAASGWNRTYSQQYPFYSGVSTRIQSMSYERLLEEHRILVGDPDDVIAGLQFHREVTGAGHFSLLFMFGGMPYAASARSLELFARHVMPQFDHTPMVAVPA